MAVGTHLPGGTASAFKSSSCLLLALRAGVVQPGRSSQTMQAFSSSAPPSKTLAQDGCCEIIGSQIFRVNPLSDVRVVPEICEEGVSFCRDSLTGGQNFGSLRIGPAGRFQQPFTS